MSPQCKASFRQHLAGSWQSKVQGTAGQGRAPWVRGPNHLCQGDEGLQRTCHSRSPPQPQPAPGPVVTLHGVVGAAWEAVLIALATDVVSCAPLRRASPTTLRWPPWPLRRAARCQAGPSALTVRHAGQDLGGPAQEQSLAAQPQLECGHQVCQAPRELDRRGPGGSNSAQSASGAGLRGHDCDHGVLGGCAGSWLVQEWRDEGVLRLYAVEAQGT